MCTGPGSYPGCSESAVTERTGGSAVGQLAEGGTQTPATQQAEATVLGILVLFGVFTLLEFTEDGLQEGIVAALLGRGEVLAGLVLILLGRRLVGVYGNRRLLWLIRLAGPPRTLFGW